LLPSAHEHPWQIHLHHRTFPSEVPTPNFRDPVTWPTTNLEGNLWWTLDRAWKGGGDLELGSLHVSDRTSREIRLVLLTLRMRKVRALVRV
jgi:hypothetical protein